MNKAVKVILNILIAIAGLAFFVLMIDMLGSVKYANREVEDPVESESMVFEYELKHRAYGEIIGGYYADRLSDFEPKPGMENIYNVAEYSHAAFMSRVYEEKGDDRMIRANTAKMEALKNLLGDYRYTADEVDEMIQKAP